jgi:hypothetical protein
MANPQFLAKRETFLEDEILAKKSPIGSGRPPTMNKIKI